MSKFDHNNNYNNTCRQGEVEMRMIYKCVGNIFKDYTHWPARVVATMTTESSPPVSLTERDKCIFCKICDGIEPNNIVHQDEDFVVFPDIRPAAPHHYLIVPRHHYLDVRHLSSQHVPMIEKMVSLSKEVLTTQGGSPDTARLGFHMPPFITVKHLHLHIIAPEQEMGLIARGIFKANSFWFASPESVIQKLREKPQ